MNSFCCSQPKSNVDLNISFRHKQYKVEIIISLIKIIFAEKGKRASDRKTYIVFEVATMNLNMMNGYPFIIFKIIVIYIFV